MTDRSRIATIARRLRIALLGVLLATPVYGTAPRTGHLDIISAQLVETGKFKWGKVVGRGVDIRIEVAEAPDCSGPVTNLAYGILIDSDKDQTTGFRKPNRLGKYLGVDAEVTALCIPSGGGFFSLFGPVTISTTSDGTTIIQISTTVDILPSVDFHYVAFATDSGRFVRAPNKKKLGAWAIFEIRLS